MSRTLELLQGAQSAIQRVAARAGHAAATRGKYESGRVSGNSYAAARSFDAAEKATEPYLENANLPVTKLQMAERRELIKLVTALFRSEDPTAPRVVTFVGIDNGSSATRIAACTSALLAQKVNEAVCVVDADLHNGSLHREFGLEERGGLSEAMCGHDPIRHYCLRLDGTLWALSNGSNIGNEGLASRDRLRARVEELRQEFAYCLMAAPPIAASADVLLIGQLVDGVVLVLEADATPREAALDARDTLAKAGVPILGVILNNRRLSLPPWLERGLG